MWKWRSGNPASVPPPLVGAPARRRQKTYTAASGYVHEYFYEGYRVADRDGTLGAEHVFRVSSDRKRWSKVEVFLEDAATQAWERERGRTLNSTERYAIVKMALFQAFDEREHPDELLSGVRVQESTAASLLEMLGID